MNTRTIGIATICFLLMIPASWAKGPKGSGGYADIIASKSKDQKTTPPASVSRIPTQAPIKPSYNKPTSQQAVPATSSQKYDRYSKQRPTTLPSRPSTTRPPVQYPTRPTTKPTTPSIPTTRPTTPSTPSRPLILYPSSKPKPTQLPSFPSTQLPATQRPPTQLPTTTQRPTQLPLRPPSRPDYSRPPQKPSGPIIINQPTTINQSTTNITNNIQNTNNWFNNNVWQNRVTINSNHWNGRPWWYTPDYGDWHHGHWHGHYYSSNRSDWSYVDSSESRWLKGLAVWGLGNLVYRTGYQAYSNPYRVQPIVIGTTTIDYARPITVFSSAYERAYANDEAKAAVLRQQSLRYFDVARQAFYLRDYDAAYTNVNLAIALMPDDAAMHEFRALVLFAGGRYREAAEVVHAVLAVAPGWDWTTLSGLYRDNDDYIAQLRRLELYVREHPAEVDARFLLAYHYITLGHNDNAAAQLRSVVQRLPDDKLAADLYDLLAADETSPPAPGSTQRPPTREQLQGEWKARRPNGKIELDMSGNEFAWDFDLDDQDDEFKGNFAVVQDVLTFATKEGSQMIGTVSMNGPDEFIFTLLGSGDEGVTFQRE